MGNEPVERGMISLIPAEGTTGPSAGGNIENGRYEIMEDGPLPGTYMVSIQAYRNTGQMVRTEALGKIVEVEETEQYIPPNYNTATELVIEITDGHNDQDFSL